MTPVHLLRRGTAAAVLALFLLVVPACGEGGELDAGSRTPWVHVIATGGTIAGAGYRIETLDGAALLRAVPALATVGNVTAEDPFTLPSSQITPQLMLDLARRIEKTFAEDDEVDGIVVTHGTDSLEETAFFLDLVVDSERPVVVTGAMRTRDEMTADGPRNLLNAVRLAAEPAARGLGVLVTLNDEVHAAREVRKVDSTSLDAFESPATGRLGYFDGDELFLLQRPLRRLHVATREVEPRVDLVVAAAGSDGHQVRAAVESGARGLVVELFGRGNAPPDVEQELLRAREKGVTVVCVSRTGSGGLADNEPWRRHGILWAEDLDGLKARLVLVASLASTAEPAVLQGYFDRLAGKVH